MTKLSNSENKKSKKIAINMEDYFTQNMDTEIVTTGLTTWNANGLARGKNSLLKGGEKRRGIKTKQLFIIIEFHLLNFL